MKRKEGFYFTQDLNQAKLTRQKLLNALSSAKNKNNETIIIYNHLY